MVGDYYAHPAVCRDKFFSSPCYNGAVMTLWGVSPAKQEELERRMAALGVRAEDLDERFVRSSGPGGQHVNKVATCVWLRHRPTGIEVKAQQERSQALNRFVARRRLVELLEERVLGLASARRQAIEKIRRQERKRSARSKAHMLEHKHRHAEKKARRRPLPPAHWEST